MNPVQQAILERRSIRGYAPSPLTTEQIDALVAAALASPSATNSQPWHFSVVQDQALLQRTHDAAAAQVKKLSLPIERFMSDDFQVFYNAPLVIFLSAATNSGLHYADIDCGIAVENIALAAQGMGLGSVILGLPRFAFEGDEADELRKALKFPEGYDFRICISIGTPATTKPEHPIGEGKVSII